MERFNSLFFSISYKSLYFSANIGYVSLEYNHILTQEEYGTKTFASGPGIGLRQNNLFKLNGLFIDFTLPILYLTKAVEQKHLENTKINKQQFAYQGFLFIGYQF